MTGVVGKRTAVFGIAALVLAAGGGWAAQPVQTRQDALARALPVPTPFAVPTTPATDSLPSVGSGRITSVGRFERSVPWSLIRIWDGGRELAIQHTATCDSGARVLVEETDRSVVVQVVAARGARSLGEGPCSSGARTLVTLDRPLGRRHLKQAGTTSQPPGEPDRTSLAETFANAPEWPGDPWFHAGREVTRDEMTLARGPEHCSWQDAVYLSGSALPAPRDENGRLWARDPQGVLEHFPRAEADFRARAVLPEDARATGHRQGNAEVWTAPSDKGDYVYLVNTGRPADAERWVRGGGGCA